jgi:hypothetical protein
MFNGFTMSLWSTAWRTRPSADEPYTWLGNTGLPIGVIRLRVLRALPAAFGLADLRLTKENLFKTDLTGLTVTEDAATGAVTVQGIDALDESHLVRRAAIARIIPTITHPSYQKKPSRRGIPVNFSSIEKPVVLVPGQPPVSRTEAAVVLSKEYAVTLTRQALNNHLRKGRSIEDLRAFCKAGCDPHFFAAKPLQFPDGTSTTYAEFGRRIGKGGLWGVGADPVPQAAPCGASASACGKTDASIP